MRNTLVLIAPKAYVVLVDYTTTLHDYLIISGVASSVYYHWAGGGGQIRCSLTGPLPTKSITWFNIFEYEADIILMDSSIIYDKILGPLILKEIQQSEKVHGEHSFFSTKLQEGLWSDLDNNSSLMLCTLISHWIEWPPSTRYCTFLPAPMLTVVDWYKQVSDWPGLEIVFSNYLSVTFFSLFLSLFRIYPSQEIGAISCRVCLTETSSLCCTQMLHTSSFYVSG